MVVEKSREEELALLLGDSIMKAKRKYEDECDGPRKQRAVSRFNRERAHLCIDQDYFSPNSTFNDRQFERHFRISKSIANHLLLHLANHDIFFMMVMMQSVAHRFAQ